MDVFWNKFRILASISLLVIIIIRLMWLDVRPKPPRIEPRFISELQHGLQMSNYETSLNLCNISSIKNKENSALRYSTWVSTKSIVSLLKKHILAPCLDLKMDYKDILGSNKYLLITLVFILSLTARILTKSWLVSLVVGASLLSSSTIVPYRNLVGFSLYGQLFVAFWGIALAFFSRGSNKLSTSLLALTSALGIYLGLYSLALWCICLVPAYKVVKKLTGVGPHRIVNFLIVSCIYLITFFAVANLTRHDLGPYSLATDPSASLTYNNGTYHKLLHFSDYFRINTEGLLSGKLAASFVMAFLYLFFRPRKNMQAHYKFNLMFFGALTGIVTSTLIAHFCKKHFGILLIDPLMLNYIEWFAPLIMTLGISSLYSIFKYCQETFLRSK